MFKRIIAASMPLFVAVMILGCEGRIIVQEPPPVEEVEIAPAPPGSGFIWIGGYWRWNDRWVWIPGRWERPPSSEFIWETPRWERHIGENRWEWHEGRWRHR